MKKYDALLKHIAEDQELAPHVQYDVKGLYRLNPSILNEALSQFFYPGESYRPFSLYSAKSENDKLTIQSCVEFPDLANDQIFSLNSRVDFFQTLELIESSAEDKLILLENGAELLISVITTVYKIKKIKSYTKTDNIVVLDYLNLSDYQSLDWILQRSIGIQFGIEFDQEIWTNQSKKTLFNRWINQTA
jgi:uncharacterized protein YlaN (UPF0358 family)